MTLRDFLRVNKISVRAFAADIGEDESIARKWVYGYRQPSLPSAVLIEDYTKGAVRARDLVAPGKEKPLPATLAAAG